MDFQMMQRVLCSIVNAGDQQVLHATVIRSG
jgi:hypothetical protein